MCGRYSIATDVKALQDAFNVVADLTEGFVWPRYNLAPSQTLPVIESGTAGERVLLLARWGLIPSWAREPSALHAPINAKAETAAVKPMFRHAYRKARVLVPATGFYEWQAIAGSKQPYFIAMTDDRPFAFGGLLERWRGDGGTLTSFAILTTTPNELCAGIHERMPVIIRPADYASWLSPANTDPARIAEMIGPYPADEMRAWPVSRRVNNVRNDDAALTDPDPSQP